MKDFKHYVVLVNLSKGGYWMRVMNAAGLDRLKTIACNGHKYEVNRKYVFALHGWYPFLKENRWNAWRQVYNMIYRYFIATGLLYYEEPEDPLHGVEKPVPPMTWNLAQEKWTPGLVQAVNLSHLEERYNKHINFGTFTISWKVALIIGVVVIVALLIYTGRIPI
jgi:hypothetical protein